MINDSGFFVIYHGVWYRNGELPCETFTSDRTLTHEEMDELQRIKEEYLKLHPPQPKS